MILEFNAMTKFVREGKADARRQEADGRRQMEMAGGSPKGFPSVKAEGRGQRLEVRG